MIGLFRLFEHNKSVEWFQKRIDQLESEVRGQSKIIEDQRKEIEEKEIEIKEVHEFLDKLKTKRLNKNENGEATSTSS